MTDDNTSAEARAARIAEIRAHVAEHIAQDETNPGICYQYGSDVAFLLSLLAGERAGAAEAEESADMAYAEGWGKGHAAALAAEREAAEVHNDALWKADVARYEAVFVEQEATLARERENTRAAISHVEGWLQRGKAAEDRATAAEATVRGEMLREVMTALGMELYARPDTPQSLWEGCLATIRGLRAALVARCVTCGCCPYCGGMALSLDRTVHELGCAALAA